MLRMVLASLPVRIVKKVRHQQKVTHRMTLGRIR